VTAGCETAQAVDGVEAVVGSGRFLPTCVVDDVLTRSPAEHVRRPVVPAESPTLGLTHLQFEAMLTTARPSTHSCDFALVAMLRAARPENLRSHRRRNRRPDRRAWSPGAARARQGRQGRPGALPPAVSRSLERAIGDRTTGPILLSSRGPRMDRHCASRSLKRLSEHAGVTIARMHPHMLRRT
jgi:integrase/recombinase XerD